MGRHQVNSLNCLGSQISFPRLIQVKSYLSLPLLLALLLIFCWLWFLKPREIFSLSPRLGVLTLPRLLLLALRAFMLKN